MTNELWDTCLDLWKIRLALAEMERDSKGVYDRVPEPKILGLLSLVTTVIWLNNIFHVVLAGYIVNAIPYTMVLAAQKQIGRVQWIITLAFQAAAILLVILLLILCLAGLIVSVPDSRNVPYDASELAKGRMGIFYNALAPVQEMLWSYALWFLGLLVFQIFFLVITLMSSQWISLCCTDGEVAQMPDVEVPQTQTTPYAQPLGDPQIAVPQTQGMSQPIAI